jgi:putative intracellular protease/amidase
MTSRTDTIGVLIEEHFDAYEFTRFNEFLPAHGFRLEYLSHLWGQPALRFGSNSENGQITQHVTVTAEVNDADVAEYNAILLIGGYAMDRLRYQTTIRKGQKNQAPAVNFLRRALVTKVPIGTICHALWLFCADPDLLRGRRVTCAHNIVGDVENAGAEVVYGANGAADLVIDGNLISARHPECVDAFLAAVVQAVRGGPPLNGRQAPGGPESSAGS